MKDHIIEGKLIAEVPRIKPTQKISITEAAKSGLRLFDNGMFSFDGTVDVRLAVGYQSNPNRALVKAHAQQVQKLGIARALENPILVRLEWDTAEAAIAHLKKVEALVGGGDIFPITVDLVPFRAQAQPDEGFGPTARWIGRGLQVGGCIWCLMVSLLIALMALIVKSSPEAYTLAPDGQAGVIALAYGYGFVFLLLGAVINFIWREKPNGKASK